MRISDWSSDVCSSDLRQDVEQWDDSMAINARSHWVTAAEALGPMLERGRGSFVFVSSVAAWSSNGFALSYEASKAAQLAISRHIAARSPPPRTPSNPALSRLKP